MLVIFISIVSATFINAQIIWVLFLFDQNRFVNDDFIGRSNNSYNSGRSGHSHGGKSARSRRYAAGEGERFERGTHPYSVPSSGPVTVPPSSVNSSSRHPFREENSSIER